MKKHYKFGQHTFIIDDFRNVTLEEKANLVFADVPFGIDYSSKGAWKSEEYKGTHSYVDIPKEEYPAWIQELVDWSYNNLKDDGSMWLLISWHNLIHALNAINKSDFTLLNHCIWEYRTTRGFTKYKFVTLHYHMLLLVKDINNYTFHKPERFARDVWHYKKVKEKHVKVAATELPPILVTKAIYTSTDKGDLVVDPCVGSGTTFQACSSIGRIGIGIDINPDMKERIEEKLRVSMR